jgi:hypothetical protein
VLTFARSGEKMNIEIERDVQREAREEITRSG